MSRLDQDLSDLGVTSIDDGGYEDDEAPFKRAPLARKGGDGGDSSRSLDADAELDEDELSEDEKDQVAKRCLLMFSIFLVLLGGALTGGALYVSTLVYSSVGEALAYSVAAVGGTMFATNVLGLAGLYRVAHTKILLVYFTIHIFLTFAMLLVGGFSLILNTSAVDYVDTNWDAILAGLEPSQRTSLAGNKAGTLKTIATSLYVLGGVSLGVLLANLAALSNVVRLVTPVRAHTVLVQATNVSLLPIGVALIAAAAYIADTSVGPETAAASFALFILGVFVILLLLVGCAGSSLQSRGIIRLFLLLTCALGISFLTFGAVALVQSGLVASFISSRWESLRKVLPPDFSGKYDREQFEKFVTANLTAVGFLALVAGLVQSAQVYGSVRLRSELKLESELEQEAFEAAAKGLIPRSVAETIAARHIKTRAQVLWKQQWTKGTKKSRRCIASAFGCVCLLVATAVSLSVAALYYTSNCTAIVDFSASRTYSSSFGPYAKVTNAYTRGNILVRLAPQGSATPSDVAVTYRKAAYKPSMAPSDFPAPVLTLVPPSTSYGGVPDPVLPLAGAPGFNVTSLKVAPIEKTTLAGVDLSCQNADVLITLPRAASLPLPSGFTGAPNSFAASTAEGATLALEVVAGTGATAIDLDLTPPEGGGAAATAVEAPRLRRLVASADDGTIDVANALLGARGASLTSGTGSITLSSVSAICDPADLGEGVGGIRIATNKGGVTVEGLESLDCDVFVSGNAALSRVTRSRITNTAAGGHLTLYGAKGVMQVDSSYVQVLDMKGEDGSVRVSNVTVTESLKAASQTGLITLKDLKLAQRGNLQIETDTGAIEVHAAEFAGIISVVTGGSIACSGDGFDDGAAACKKVTAGGTVDAASGQTTLVVVEQVMVNCKAYGDCAYLGQITITTTRGDVTLVMDPWTSWRS